MDAGIQLTVDNPRKKANIFSIACFGWMIGLFRKAITKGFLITDLYKPLDAHKSDALGDKLEKHWNDEVKRAKLKNEDPSLYTALAKTFLAQYMVYGIFMFIQFVIFRTFQPVVLGYLIKLFSKNPNEPDLEMKMYVSATVMILISLITVFMTHHCNFGQGLIGMKLRIAVSTLIYRKMLRLSKKSLGQTAAGQIVNLLSNDVARFDFVAFMLHYIWISPFQVAIVTYFIWDEVGIASLAGILSMLCFTLPIQGYLAKITSGIRTKIAMATDTRVRLMSEIISGVQVIKMYAWEKPFEFMVKTIRKREIKVLTQAAYIRGVYMSCMVFVERTTLYLTVITYVLMDDTNVIHAEQVYSMQQFFNQLQMCLAIFLPMAISIGAEAVVSIRRFKTFLMLDEKLETKIEITNGDKISINKIQAAWTSENEHLTLDNINIDIPAGKLCAIIGPVGSGKSSMLQLLLGELATITGSVSLCGNISYSSQEPWLFQATVRNNILFGQEYDRQLYHKVTKACALLPDFDQFPQRDQTIVGERGVSLSGGQRARINLARAVYRQADIYLMDDPLSAVDTHVGKQLFDECISKYLKGKTRILVTHQLQYLKAADWIVVLNEGKIEAQGTFQDLSSSKLDFTKMLIAADETNEVVEEVEKVSLTRQASTVSTNSAKSLDEDTDPKKDSDETEEVSSFEKSAMKEYLKAAGNCCVVFTVVLVFILGQVACSGADYWISFWTKQEEIRHANDTKILEKSNTWFNTFDSIIDNTLRKTNIIYQDDFVHNSSEYVRYQTEPYYRSFDWDLIFGEPIDTNWAIYIYTVIIIIVIILTLVRTFSFFKVCMVASTNLHHMMFSSLLEAPMRFFDVNPSGRVLNRFSKDMGAVDETLPRVALEAIQIMLVMVGSLVMISVTNWYMIIAMVVFAILFVFLRKWYLETVKVIKHLEGIVKSPVFSHLNSSLNGISTIRASQAEMDLIQQFDKLQDVHTSAWYLTVACTSSFGLWIDMICVLFTAMVTYSFILLNQSGSISGSIVGLAISQSLVLTGMLQHGMRQSAEVVNQMTSVERILQYTLLAKEGPFDSPNDKDVPKNWPDSGKVKFSHMFLHYTPMDPPVLKDLDFDIEPGKKIGIVGRTGAGKSSLISAMFRLAPMEGHIEIDGLSSKSLGLNKLRKNISIIPQEPVLFSATLRYNLDPFNEFEDSQLWNALEEVELKEAVTSLDFQVDEGGANFSLGQRQLICLARAILRNNKILVLDEATANVDPQTDALIQTTIRKKFAECTVLTIAHRLNTIIDTDKVLVMDFGKMVEFDHPHTLLQNKNGFFSQMVEQTGPTMTKTLHQIAYEKYCNDNGLPIKQLHSLDASKGDKLAPPKNITRIERQISESVITDITEEKEDSENSDKEENKKTI